ncbi:DUF551 domain-containing protein [Enterobacter hormaechei]|uniref:DUF551 domain-containing protein n=1 Tax=Enterobacter hormaechei TaxID=158836 RepID=UPI003DA2EE2B
MKNLTIDWLNKCRCGNKSYSVKTARGNNAALWDDDAVKCNSCGRGGVIQVCEGQARVLWETDEEMAENKPMSTITRERVAGIANGEKCYTHDDVVELARIALASLEAEPSYFVNRVKHSDAYGEDVELRTYCYELDALKSKDDFGGEIVPVYTVPPAPFALPVQHWEELCRQNPDMSIGDAIIRAAWWNHCAAMLQGAEPVSNRDELPDGWVACSERLPPEGYEPDGGAVCYLVWHKNEVDCGPQYSISNVFFLRKHWEWNFTHWMPLPAAPQQEADNE